MEKKLQIKGVGKMNLKVDQIEFSISLNSLKTEYNDAYQNAKIQLKQLQDDLHRIGFDKDEIKTNSFNVRQHFENYRDENNAYKNKMTGYEVNHSLTLKCDYDTDALAEIIETLSNCEAKPQFNINFTIKDKEKAKNDLLCLITKDARNKAKILAKENKIKLVGLVDIDYCMTDNDFYSPTVYDYAVNAKCVRAEGMSISVDDIQIEGSARFVWEFE